MKRIIIIGCSGSGKTILARKMGDLLGLPVHHLDKLHWLPGWVRPPDDEWRQIQQELVSGDQWIIDGNYGGTLNIRLEACDTVVYLAFSKYRCLYRVFKRSTLGRNRTRSDLNPECPEQMPDWEWIRWIWRYPKHSGPRVLEKIAASDAKKTIVLRSPRDVRQFLRSLTAQAP